MLPLNCNAIDPQPCDHIGNNSNRPCILQQSNNGFKTVSYPFFFFFFSSPQAKSAYKCIRHLIKPPVVLHDTWNNVPNKTRTFLVCPPDICLKFLLKATCGTSSIIEILTNSGTDIIIQCINIKLFLASRCEPSTMMVLKKLVSRMTENTVL